MHIRECVNTPWSELYISSRVRMAVVRIRCCLDKVAAEMLGVA